MKSFFYIISLLSFFSCATIYVPNTPPNHILSERGQASFTGTLGNGLEVSGAYAITNHISTFIYGGFGSFSDSSKSWTHKRRYGEIAVGYFYKADRLHVDTYFGMGSGIAEGSGTKFRLIAESQFIKSYGNYRKYFLQSGISWVGPYVNNSFVSRFSLVDFYKLIRNEGSGDFLTWSKGFFYEPSISSKISISHENNLHLVTNFGLAIPINEKSVTFNYRSYFVSAGLTYNIN